MRILFVLHVFPPDAWGGTELHVRGIADELAAEHDVRIFCRGMNPLGDQDAVTREQYEGLSVTRFNNLFEDYQSFAWTYAYRPAHEAFVRELDDFDPDVVHIHHLTGLSTTIVETLRHRRIPTVFSLHDFWMICPRGNRLHPTEGLCETIYRRKCHDCLGRIWPTWFPEGGRDEDQPPENSLRVWDDRMNEVLEAADLILTPSAFHRQRMLDETRIQPDRIIALAHGLDHGPFQDHTHDPEPRPRVIGYIGTVIESKGVHVLLEAFNLLDDPELELRIHGDTPAFHESAEYLSLMRERVRSRGPVEFRGHYDNSDVAAILEDIDILVVPSLWWETFSLTIRESMLAGVPVVASNIGAMKEAIENNGAGLLFETGDAADLARVLRRLLDDDDLRRRCSNRRDLVKTVGQNAADYLALYERAEILASQRESEPDVSNSSFPKPEKKRKKKSDKVRKTALKESPNDVDLAIEKIGDGDVRVQSAVERGKTTRVSFTFDYAADAEPSEVRLVIDFKRKTTGVIPSDVDIPDAEALPRDADSNTAQMLRSQDADWDRRRGEQAMYMLDDEIARDHADALDEMVETTTLAEEDQTIERDAKRGKKDARRDDERPKRGNDSPQGRDARPSRRDDRPSGEAAEDTRRQPRRKDRGAESPKRDRDPSPKPTRDEREPAGRRESAPKAKPAAKGGGDVVWEAGSSNWSLPEKSDDSVSKDKPERAPNHRLGRQPGLGGAKKGDFGAGL